MDITVYAPLFFVLVNNRRSKIRHKHQIIMKKINFTMPAIPQGATDNEKRTIMYKSLSEMSVSEYLEQRDNLSYLPWANCFNLFRSIYPSATYKVIKNENGLPYFADPNTGIMVFTQITMDSDHTYECFLPVMDYRNKAMKLEAYTYQVYDSYKKIYVEKTVAAATMFDINKTIWRCLVKNVAIATGIGIGVFRGEDVPEKSNDTNIQPQPQKFNKPTQTIQSPVQMRPTNSLLNAINSAKDVSELVNIYLNNTSVIESDSNLKALLTNRKKALQHNKAA